MAELIFVLYGFAAAAVAVFIARVWTPKVPSGLLISCGLGALFLSGYFLFGINTGQSIPDNAGIPTTLTGGILLTGALLFLGGLSADRQSRRAAAIQLAGSLLLLVVFALPSALVVAVPFFGLAAVASANKLHSAPKGPFSVDTGVGPDYSPPNQ